MTELVVVERVLAQSTTGVIFSARRSCGDYVRVQVPHDHHVRAGAVYSVQGAEGEYVDSAGRSWRQIEATVIRRERATGGLLARWLEQLPHVGPVRAQRLLTTFGDDLLEALSDPDAFDRIAEAIDPRRPALAQRIATAVALETSARKAEDSVLIAEARFLQTLEEHGVNDHRAARQLWRLLGSTDTDARLIANPYLAASILSWKQADHLGLRLLAARPDVEDPSTHSERTLGAIDNIWRDVLAAGDTALSKIDLVRQLRRRGVNFDDALSIGACHGLSMTDELLFRAPGAAWIEDDLAHLIGVLMTQPPKSDGLSAIELKSLVNAAEGRVGFQLTDEQREAVMKLLCNSFCVLQGGAGVGKTAVTKVICEAWESLGGTCLLTALSGKAALQLSRGASSGNRPRLGYTAARLLRMLSARKQLEMDGRIVHPEWPTMDSQTLLIVDEASMVDTPTMHQLVQKMVAGSQILLVGDHGQLPSVGIGRVFHDLVDEGSTVVTLNTVLRQSTDSPIPHAARAIREGNVPSVEIYTGQHSGFYLVPAPESQRKSSWLEVYQELCNRLNQKDVMALAGLNASVNWLNQEAATARRREMGQSQLLRLGPFATVAVGDPVVCRQNRYSDSLFNGMLGVVTSIDPGSNLSVHWDGEQAPRALSSEAAADLGLGYAITCHKSQGSSAHAVVVLLEDSRLVTREWLYTAITRARGLAVLVGAPDLLREAVARRTHRTTGFVLGHRKHSHGTEHTHPGVRCSTEHGASSL